MKKAVSDLDDLADDCRVDKKARVHVARSPSTSSRCGWFTPKLGD
jgi:hypothetical protein